MKTNHLLPPFVRSVWFLLIAFAPGLVVFAAETGVTGRTTTDYQLQSGDIIRVQVFQEPDLDREISVSKEGAIVLPLIGKVSVKGRTLSVVEQTVRALYDKDYLVNPQVTVTVVKYQLRTVNVIGAVNTPQAIEYPPEQMLTLLDAISRAGGFSRLADRKKVRLTRSYSDGRPPENIIINADKIISGTSDDRCVLQKDDVIFVPESVL